MWIRPSGKGAFDVSEPGRRAVAGLALVLVIGTGCSSSGPLQTRPRGSGVAITVPAAPQPGLSDAADADGAGNRRVPLVGLYGELLADPDGGRSGAFDGTNNVTQVTFATEGACSDPDVDPTGRWLGFASTQHRATWDIYIKPVSGQTLTQLTTDPADDMMPTWHPSGKSLAFASNRAGNWDVYVTSIEGGQPMRITDGPEAELHPSWSPDGKRLVYCKLGSMSGRWELWVVEVDNPGVRRHLGYGLLPQWCPDSSRPRILFQRARERGSRFFSIWTVDYVNGEAVHPTEIVSASNAAAINPAWSPDGGRIVFVTVVEPQESEGNPEQADVWVVNVDGSGRTNLTNGKFANYQPTWGVDGRVYFVSDRTGVDNIWAVTASRALAGFSEEPIAEAPAP